MVQQNLCLIIFLELLYLLFKSVEFLFTDLFIDPFLSLDVLIELFLFSALLSIDGFLPAAFVEIDGFLSIALSSIDGFLPAALFSLRALFGSLLMLVEESFLFEELIIDFSLLLILALSATVKTAIYLAYHLL